MIRTARAPHQELRNYPIYTIPEAALYIAMPSRTLRHWVSNEPRWAVSGSTYSTKLLSFQDLAQSYVLNFIRRHVGLSGRQTLQVLHEARRHTRSKYPLLSQDIRYVWRQVFLYKPASEGTSRQVISLTRHGQREFPEIADLFATRIQYVDGIVAQVFPWKFVKPEDQSKPLTIDPLIMSGGLVLTGTRIPARVIAERSRAGEDIPDIARDYRLGEDIIEKALRHLGLPKAA